MENLSMTPEKLHSFLGPRRVANLETLFNYLAFGELKAEFNMARYYTNAPNFVPLTKCGTAGCAVGHGPYAGIPKLTDESWNEYAERCFSVNLGIVFEYLFHSDWAEIDNTPIGAAKRIRYALDFGIPKPTKEDGLAYKKIKLKKPKKNHGPI